MYKPRPGKPREGFFGRFERTVWRLRGWAWLWSRSWFARFLSRSFPCGCTPIHPFVNASTSCGSRSDAVDRIGHGVFWCDRLALPSRLNQTNAQRLRLSPRATSDWLAGEGLFPKEGPMQPPCLIPRSAWLFLLFTPPREPLPPSPSPRPSPPRSDWGRGDGEGGTGRTPSVEPERRPRTSIPRHAAVASAVGHPACRALGT